MSARTPPDGLRFRPRVSELEDRSVPATLDLTGTTLTLTLDPGAAAGMTGGPTTLTFDAGAGNTITANPAAQAIGFTTGGRTSGAGNLGPVTVLAILGAGGTETFTIDTAGGTFPTFTVAASVETTSLNAAGFDTGGSAQTYNGPVSLAATAALSGSSVAFNSTVNGAFGLTVTATAATTFAGAVGATAPLTSLAVTTGTLTAAAIATTGGLSVGNSGAGSVTGVVSGAGTLTKSGAGTLTLSGANTYTGGTTVSTGTLVAAGATALGTAAVGTTVFGTLDVRAGIGTEALYVNNTSGLGALRTSTGFTGVVGGPVTLTAAADIGGSGVLTINGVIGGNFPVTKVGVGDIVLTAANTYTGPTTVTSGRLIVNGTQAANAVSVTGGTLGGSGRVGVLTANGGTVAPGLPAPTTPITLNVGNTNLGAATFAPVIAGTPGGGAGTLAVTGTLTLANTPFAATRTGAAATAGQSFTVIDNDGTDAVAGTFAGLPEGARVTVGGQHFVISYTGGTGNDVVLTLAPPPAQAVGGQPNGTAVLLVPNAAGEYAATPAATLSPFGSTPADVRTATGDVNGDGTPDTILVTGAARGSASTACPPDRRRSPGLRTTSPSTPSSAGVPAARSGG